MLQLTAIAWKKLLEKVFFLLFLSKYIFCCWTLNLYRIQSLSYFVSFSFEGFSLIFVLRHRQKFQISVWGQFHQRVYVQLLRTQIPKLQKAAWVDRLFVLLGFVRVKAARKILVKLTPGSFGPTLFLLSFTREVKDLKLEP